MVSGDAVGFLHCPPTAVPWRPLYLSATVLHGPSPLGKVKKKKEKKNPCSCVLSSESHITLSFPEHESCAGLASILPLPEQPAAGQRRGKRCSAEYFRRKRVSKEEKKNVSWNRSDCHHHTDMFCNSWHQHAGGGHQHQDVVLSTMVEKVQPLHLLAPSRWNYPFSLNNKHKNAIYFFCGFVCLFVFP